MSDRRPVICPISPPRTVHSSGSRLPIRTWRRGDRTPRRRIRAARPARRTGSPRPRGTARRRSGACWPWSVLLLVEVTPHQGGHGAFGQFAGPCAATWFGLRFVGEPAHLAAVLAVHPHAEEHGPVPAGRCPPDVPEYLYPDLAALVA